MVHVPILERSHPYNKGGIQKIYRFENGYGASVVQIPGSLEGMTNRWEVGVIAFIGPDALNFELCPENIIELIPQRNPIRLLTLEDVESILDAIKELK